VNRDRGESSFAFNVLKPFAKCAYVELLIIVLLGAATPIVASNTIALLIYTLL
jgi:hypothetical protein